MGLPRGPLRIFLKDPRHHRQTFGKVFLAKKGKPGITLALIVFSAVVYNFVDTPKQKKQKGNMESRSHQSEYIKSPIFQRQVMVLY